MTTQIAQLIAQQGGSAASQAGSGLRQGVENYVKARELTADRQLKRAAFTKQQQDEAIKALFPVVASADTADKWATAQGTGMLPKNLGYDMREPLMMRAMGDQAMKAVEVGDPTSGTGTRMVPGYQAFGKEGKPKSGTSLTVDKEGNVTFSQGVGAGGADVTNPTLNKVQQKILDKGDVMAQLTQIKSSYKPEYQQIGARTGFAWDSMRTKYADTPIGAMMGSVSTEDQAALMDYVDYRSGAAQMFSTILNDISGVAVNPTEFKRAEAWLPNPGSGIFDGDSPVELEAKMQRMEQFTRNALMKYSYINKRGLSIDDVDVKDMPSVMQERGTQLAEEYGKKGLRGEVLKSAVKQSLADEFGLAR